MKHALSYHHHQSCTKQLLKFPRAVQIRAEQVIDALADTSRPHGVESLKGLPDAYRIRVGDYRVIYDSPATTPFSGCRDINSCVVTSR